LRDVNEHRIPMVTRFAPREWNLNGLLGRRQGWTPKGRGAVRAE
jgi:hypothetical protein